MQGTPIIVQFCAVDKAVDGEKTSDFAHASVSVARTNDGIAVLGYHRVVPTAECGIQERGTWQNEHCQRQSESAG